MREHRARAAKVHQMALFAAHRQPTDRRHVDDDLRLSGAKHISHHAFGFVHEKFLVTLRDDASSILPTMLKQ